MSETWHEAMATARAFAVYLWRRFIDDRCLRIAAALSYTSLLALVPLTAIAFAILAAFPVFEDVRGSLESMLFQNFLPESAAAIRGYFHQFVANTAKLTAIGVVGLAATAVMMLWTIESSLNTIFRVARPRPLVPRLLVFWALITVGPLLIGASFSLSTYFFALQQWLGVENISGPLGPVTGFVPTFIMIVAFAALYVIIPNRGVPLGGALLGATVAGLLFAGLRRGFALYVASFPTYQTLYGALSLVPIFLVWMYLSWAVVLFGAVLTDAVTEWRSAGGPPVEAPLAPAHELVTALSILDLLHAASRKGGGVPRKELLREVKISDAAFEHVLGTLRAGGYVERTARDTWILCRDLSLTTLNDLMVAFGVGLRPEDLSLEGEAWRLRVSSRFIDIMRAQRRIAEVSLEEILSAQAEPEEKSGQAPPGLRPVS